MTPNQLKCPKCNSENIREGSVYASIRPEGQPASKETHRTPNYCWDCEHQRNEEERE